MQATHDPETGETGRSWLATFSGRCGMSASGFVYVQVKNYPMHQGDGGEREG